MAERPYRVSYYDICEIQDGKAPLRFEHLLLNDPDEREIEEWLSLFQPTAVLVRWYPYYKKNLKTKSKTFVTVSGPDSPATKAVVKELNKVASYDQHEQWMDSFKTFDSTKCPWHPGAKLEEDGRCTFLDPTDIPYPDPQLGKTDSLCGGVINFVPKTSNCTTIALPENTGKGAQITCSTPEPVLNPVNSNLDKIDAWAGVVQDQMQEVKKSTTSTKELIFYIVGVAVFLGAVYVCFR